MRTDRPLRTRLAIAAVLVAALVIDCSSLRVRGPLADLPPAELFPLTPGRSWVYRLRDAAGHVSRLEARVKGDVELASEPRKLTLVEEHGGYPGEKKLEASSDLVAYYARGGLIFRVPWTSGAEVADALRFSGGGEPVIAEEPDRQPTWRGRYSVLAVEGTAMAELQSDSRVAASDDTVIVPAGTFRHCLRVETTVSASAPTVSHSSEILHYYTEWYAPGIGLVKAQTAVDVDGRRLDVLAADLASIE